MKSILQKLEAQREIKKGFEIVYSLQSVVIK
jgi:hypothetical protein